MVAYSFKERFVLPIEVGLGRWTQETWQRPTDVPRQLPHPKRQTIRAIGKRRHARPGEVIQLYTGMRTKNCRSIGVGRCVSVDPIRLFVALDYITIPDLERGGNYFLNNVKARDFARADGFEDAKEMHAFWEKEHGRGYFDGLLIKWEPIR